MSGASSAGRSAGSSPISASPYVDLDSVAYQKDDLGGAIRAALRERIGSPTIPQVFVGGTLVGGCTETLDAADTGRLQALLTEAGVPFAQPIRLDARAYLPRWVHPRREAV